MNLKAISSNPIQSDRMRICEACKWYVKPTQSCGTLIKARFDKPVGTLEKTKIKNNRVTHYNKPIHLCGCFMPAKVKFVWSRCPAEKWGVDRVTDEDLQRLKEIVTEFDRIGKVHDHHEFIVFLRKLTGENVQQSECHSCILDMISLARQATIEIE